MTAPQGEIKSLENVHPFFGTSVTLCLTASLAYT